ncbi:MAG: hypothetical protein AAFY35_13780 [Pseudomonadota bacterium]
METATQDQSGLVIFLILFTFGAIIAWALISKWRTEKRKDDDSVPKSTLAKDGPDTR